MVTSEWLEIGKTFGFPALAYLLIFVDNRRERAAQIGAWREVGHEQATAMREIATSVTDSRQQQTIANERLSAVERRLSELAVKLEV